MFKTSLLVTSAIAIALFWLATNVNVLVRNIEMLLRVFYQQNIDRLSRLVLINPQLPWDSLFDSRVLYTYTKIFFSCIAFFNMN